MNAVAEKRPLLDIEFLIRRPQVVIDGIAFDLFHPDELTILGRARQAARVRRIRELLGAASLTTTELSELAGEVDTACRAILVAPDEVHCSLKDGQRMAVLDRFGGLSWLRRRAARALKAMTTATWGSSSPAWFASTAAPP